MRALPQPQFRLRNRVLDWSAMRRRAAWLILLGAAGPVFSQALPDASQDTFNDVRRIVAIGDVHGDYQRLLELLRTAVLIDAKNTWTGGDTHLVLNGDFVDRGDHSAQVMDLLMNLEPQARKAGGRLHALIGNHEAMNLYGDLRYVTKEDFAGFQGPDSKDLQDRQMRAALDDLKRQGTPPADENAWRKKFQDEHPLGWAEQRMAFQPDGKYGKWLRQLNAIIKINDAVFLHGGISAKYAALTRGEINTRVRKELSNFSQLAGGIVTDNEGPLWYRGMAQLPDDDRGMAELLPRVLARQQARHIVIGHTPQLAVMPRFGGKVIAIDVGLSKPFDGPPAFLLIEDGKYFAMHRGRRIELPVDGGSVPEYLRSIAPLEPDNSPLRGSVQKARP
jgi:Calcineurin-like phosphoesterase